jgi:hypothetical protein
MAVVRGIWVHLAIRVAAWFLLLLPLASLTSLIWQEYLRVGVLTVGLGYGLAVRTSGGLPTNWKQVVSAASFLFILSQFVSFSSFGENSISSGSLRLPLSFFVLLVLAATPVTFLIANHRRARLTLLDGVVIAIGILLFLLSIGLKFAFEEATAWPEEILPAGLVIIWFISRQTWVSRNYEERNYWIGLVSAFLLVSLIGCLKIGRAHYYTWSGQRNLEKSDLNTALKQYANLESLSQGLGLESLHDESLLRQAQILHKQGAIKEVSRVLSMGDSFQIVVSPKEWEGPVGSMLYKNTSCWADLKLYAGKIQLDVFARGQPAQNIWPRMRVCLDDQVLGEVDVTSGGTKPYHFLAETHSGKARLEISFLNDLWQLGVLDRNLYIEQAEITYQEIDW